MQPFAFCNRCRGMKVGLNRLYIMHCLMCREWLSKTSKLLILGILLCVLIFTFPATGGLVLSDFAAERSVPRIEASFAPTPPTAAVAALEGFMERHKVQPTHRSRIARAIVTSSRKYDIDPRLVTSIMIVESGANPFAISSSDSIGVMQIHLHTWGQTADKEDINLFKIEDNVDFGVRILRDYIKRYGIWEGVKRYKGWNGNPTSESNADEYVRKVQQIFGYRPPDQTSTTAETQ